jgi:hypothetical protein
MIFSGSVVEEAIVVEPNKVTCAIEHDIVYL